MSQNNAKVMTYNDQQRHFLTTPDKTARKVEEIFESATSGEDTTSVVMILTY
jgi:hypothetical protein